MLLYSLPASYENFRVAIESRDALLTPEVLKVKVLEEYGVRAQSDVIDVAGALAVRSNLQRRTRRRRNNNKRSSPDNSNEPWCYKCRKAGHIAPNCPESGNTGSNGSQKAKQFPTKSPKSNAHAADDSYLAYHALRRVTKWGINTRTMATGFSTVVAPLICVERRPNLRPSIIRARENSNWRVNHRPAWRAKAQ